VTHAYLGLTAFDLTATAIGYAVLHGLGLRLGIRGTALAFFTGWAVLGVGLTTLLTLGVSVDLAVILVFSALVAGASLSLRRIFPVLERPRPDTQRDPLLRGLVLLGGGLLALGLVTAFIYGLRAEADSSQDLYTTWLVRAKSVYYFHDFSTGLSGIGTYWPHSFVSYPMLMPVLTAVSFHFMGSAQAGTVLLPLEQSIVVIAFFGSLVTLLSSHVPRWLLYPSLSMLLLAPGYWHRVIFVLPDLTLAYFVTLVGVAGILWLEEQRGAWLVLGTLFVAAATLTKAEGLGLGGGMAVAVVGAAVAMHRRRGLRSAVLLAGVVFIEPWYHWLSSHGLPLSSGEYSWSELFHAHFLSKNFWKLRYALVNMERWVFSGAEWLLIPALIVVTLLLVAPTRRAISAAVAGWLVAAFSAIAAVYWIGKLDVHSYVAYSMTRITTVLPIVAGTMIPLLLGLAIEHRARAAARAETP
jgi:hypothetical protein